MKNDENMAVNNIIGREYDFPWKGWQLHVFPTKPRNRLVVKKNNQIIKLLLFPLKSFKKQL